MPLDPMIANPTLVKMADPSETYKNALQNAYLFHQIDEARQKRADIEDSREAYAKGVRPDGTLDISATVNALAPKRGDLIPGVLKGASDRAKVDAETKGLGSKAAKDDADAGKAKTERVNKELANVHSLLAGVSATDPVTGQHEMFGVIKQMAKNPVIKEWYESMGKTEDQFISDRAMEMMPNVSSPEAWGTYAAQMKAGPGQMLEALKQQTIQRNLGGHNQLVQVDPHNPNTTPKVVADDQVTMSPNRPNNQVTVVNEAKKAVGVLDKETAKIVAERMKGALTAADAAQASIPRLQRIQQLVRDGNVFTGVTGESKAHLRQLAEEFGLVKPDGSVANTQELQMLVGRNLMGEIAALKSQGVVLTPMSDSDAKRLEQAALTRAMTPQELDRAAQITIEARQAEVKKYGDILHQYRSNPATASAAEMLGVPDIQQPGPAPTGTMAGNGKVPSPANVEALKAGRITPAVFDKVYGAGAAARAKGQQPGDGGAPAGGATFPGQSIERNLESPLVPIVTQHYAPPAIHYTRDGGVGQWRSVVDAASAHTGVPAAIIEAVMNQESGGDYQALSPVGALGLMQLMPDTANGLKVNPHDPYQNVLGGAKYLRQMYDKFGNWRDALAAYNAGPDDTEANPRIGKRIGPFAKSHSDPQYRVWEAPSNSAPEVYGQTQHYVKTIEAYIRDHNQGKKR